MHTNYGTHPNSAFYIADLPAYVDGIMPWEGRNMKRRDRPASRHAALRILLNRFARPRRLIVACVVVLVVAFVASLSLGRYTVPFGDVVRIVVGQLLPGLAGEASPTAVNVVMNARLPRVFAAVLVGGSLALSGCTYQGVFKNPLVSPDLLGVSSGACVGAGVAILLHLSPLGVGLAAMVGGMVAVAISVLIPRMFHTESNLMLVLAGVIVSGFMSSLLALIKYTADAESELPSIVYWTMGSLSDTLMANVVAIAPVMLVAMVVLILLRWRINLLSLGETAAKSMGVDVPLTRGISILCATVLTACSICLSGTVGWVGLVVPHIARMLVGPDNVYCMPASLLLGSAFMLVIDTAARTLTGGELPLGILTGIVGAPVFLILLARQHVRPS